MTEAFIDTHYISLITFQSALHISVIFLFDNFNKKKDQLDIVYCQNLSCYLLLHDSFHVLVREHRIIRVINRYYSRALKSSLFNRLKIARFNQIRQTINRFFLGSNP